MTWGCWPPAWSLRNNQVTFFWVLPALQDVPSFSQFRSLDYWTVQKFIIKLIFETVALKGVSLTITSLPNLLYFYFYKLRYRKFKSKISTQWKPHFYKTYHYTTVSVSSHKGISEMLVWVTKTGTTLWGYELVLEWATENAGINFFCSSQL